MTYSVSTLHSLLSQSSSAKQKDPDVLISDDVYCAIKHKGSQKKQLTRLDRKTLIQNFSSRAGMFCNFNGKELQNANGGCYGYAGSGMVNELFTKVNPNDVRKLAASPMC